MNSQRYSRQAAFAPLGQTGQELLQRSTVVICGCGALGTAQANLLVRAGVGKLILIDRDFVDLTNLQRQSLFTEQDVSQQLPKSVAARAHLERINSEVLIESVVADVTHENILEAIEGADLVLDGTDNFETRFLINEACWKLKIPWVFAGCLGAEGQTMTIVPGRTACFQCLIPEPPDAGAVATCETGGILGAIIQAMASIQVCEAIKILTHQWEALSTKLTVLNLWDLSMRQVKLGRLKEKGCPVCREKNYQWLTGKRGSQVRVLCGRNSVQIRPTDLKKVNLQSLGERLQSLGTLLINDYLLRLDLGDHSLTVFPDGRAIVTGTEDPTEARQLVSRYIGN